MLLDRNAPGDGSRNATRMDWRKTLQERLPFFGHRNWIIVADAAFPAYSQGGIETVIADQDLPTVVSHVAQAIFSSKHVRATVFLDQELEFVPEHNYPGIARFRSEVTTLLATTNLSSIPHSQVLSVIDDAGRTFRVLLIKTNTTIPYTSVYMRLDCGYLSDEIDDQIRNSIAAAE